MEENVEIGCRTFGCPGVLLQYRDYDNKLKGGYCKICNTEFKLENEIWSSEATFKVPTLCCIPVSEYADDLKWEEIDNEQVLKAGDHVTWWRAAGYWHHSIVKSIDQGKHTIVVYEVGCRAIKESEYSPKDAWAFLFRSPMYKVRYPSAVERKNPPELVLMRARCQLHPQCYQFCRDNCEHFAQFCKTGNPQSSQLEQLVLTCLTGWSKRLIFAVIRLVIGIVVSEKIAETTYFEENVIDGDIALIQLSQRNQDWISALVLLTIELFYLLICGLVMNFHDVKRTRNLGYDIPDCCSNVIIFCFLKIVAQSLLAVSLSIIFSIPVRKHIQGEVRWTRQKITRVEIGLGITGALFGNFLGYFVFQILPMLVHTWQRDNRRFRINYQHEILSL